jgi:hypothetical protein
MSSSTEPGLGTAPATVRRGSRMRSPLRGRGREPHPPPRFGAAGSARHCAAFEHGAVGATARPPPAVGATPSPGQGGARARAEATTEACIGVVAAPLLAPGLVRIQRRGSSWLHWKGAAADGALRRLEMEIRSGWSTTAWGSPAWCVVAGRGRAPPETVAMAFCHTSTVKPIEQGKTE